MPDSKQSPLQVKTQTLVHKLLEVSRWQQLPAVLTADGAGGGWLPGTGHTGQARSPACEGAPRNWPLAFSLVNRWEHLVGSLKEAEVSLALFCGIKNGFMCLFFLQCNMDASANVVQGGAFQRRRCVVSCAHSGGNSPGAPTCSFCISLVTEKLQGPTFAHPLGVKLQPQILSSFLL